MRKPDFCICENKDAKLISAFVFAIRIVQVLYYLKPKLQASRHLLWLYCPVCVGPGRKPRRPVFSERGSNIVSLVFTCMYSKNLITVLIMRVPQVTTLKKAYQLPETDG